MTTTFDQALTTARLLPPRERAQLVAQLALELVEPHVSPRPRMTDSEARAVRAELRAHFAAQGADVPLLSDQLERDREERQAILEGRAHVQS
jgi:hypothetical protein